MVKFESFSWLVGAEEQTDVGVPGMFSRAWSCIDSTSPASVWNDLVVIEGSSLVWGVQVCQYDIVKIDYSPLVPEAWCLLLCVRGSAPTQGRLGNLHIEEELVVEFKSMFEHTC